MKTAGDILKEAREKNHITIEEASRKLKIHKKFLEALENSNYDVFSDAVHVKGFLRNYAKFLGLDQENVLAFWRREYKEEKTPNIERFSIKPLFKPKVFITPGIILSSIAIISILGFFAYLYFQYRSFAGAPFLAVESPSTNISTNNTSLDIFGRVDKDANLTLNGQKISQSPEGTFAIKVSLSQGVNVLNFVATSKLGKKSKVTRTILVNRLADSSVLGSSKSSETKKEENEGLEPKTIKLELEIIKSASWLSVIEDGKKVFEGVMLKGVKTIFSGKKYIKVKAGNASAVKVYLNGKDLGVLGEDETVTEKVFKK